jgi:hypothetical protein
MLFRVLAEAVRMVLCSTLAVIRMVQSSITPVILSSRIWRISLIWRVGT